MPLCSSAPLLHCVHKDMKFTMIPIGLLGLFLASAFADYNINVNDDGNSGGSGQQTVSVNNEHNVANIDNNNGWDSWNSLWDYNTGFAATRLFVKKSCIVHKMREDAMPSFQALDAMVKEKKLQGKGPRKPSPKSLMYSVNPNQVDDLNRFGKNIAGMCQGIPTYEADEIQRANLPFYSEKCYNANIFWILKTSYCGKVVEN